MVTKRTAIILGITIVAGLVVNAAFDVVFGIQNAWSSEWWRGFLGATIAAAGCEVVRRDASE